MDTTGQIYRDLATVYSSTCPQCGGKRVLPVSAGNGPWDDILDDIARRLYNEQISKGSIPDSMFRKTADELLKAMDEGLGGSSFSFDDGRNTLKAYLQQNITAFSAAKSLTEMNHMRELMAEAKDFTDFRNKVFDAGYQFNVNWLRTEYETFSAAAQMAAQWDQFIAEGVSVLTYTTVGDDRVRPAHAALDGLTLPIDSPVIRRIYPPIDWLCRCTMVPGIEDRITDDITAGKLVKENVKNPLFQHHAGLDKTVVSDDHPYFKAVGKELDAVKNYNLPTVKKLYDEFKWPARIEMASDQEYRAWWKDMVNIKNTDNFVLLDKTGVNVLFDSVETPGNDKPGSAYFKDHILLKSNESRWKYAANLEKIVTDPDEIWSTRISGKIVRYYIGYFDNAPITVIAYDKAGTITAETMYELTEARATELRRGELIFVKK